MIARTFNVFSLCNEISLNNIAAHFGIKRSFQWEDFLILEENNLKGILKEPKSKMVNIFYFGSIVFINMEHHEIVDVVNYLKKIEKNLANPTYQYKDDYRLEVTEEAEFTVNYDSMSVREYQSYQAAILSIVLAKSVALEKIETDMNTLVDEVEKVVVFLEKGMLNVRDKKLAKMSARILGFKFNMISYLMLLDKPDITWVKEDSEILYNDLSHLFELNDRYDKIQAKSETLMDITQVFTSLSHQRRGNKLEWMVIILILIEIVLTLVEYIFLR